MRYLFSLLSVFIYFTLIIGIPPASSQVDLGSTNPTTMRKPMFKVEAVDFVCLDESGADLFGSDEVVTYFSTRHANPELAVTRKIGNVDSVDREIYHEQENCILPRRIIHNVGQPKVLQGPDDAWECDEVGVPGPIQFTIVMYEDDHTITFPQCFPAPGSPTLDVEGINCADDLIGKETVSFTEAVLVSMLPNVGQERNFEITLGGKCGPIEEGKVCGTNFLTPTGPEYQFSFRITRLPDKIIESQILDDR